MDELKESNQAIEQTAAMPTSLTTPIVTVMSVAAPTSPSPDAKSPDNENSPTITSPSSSSPSSTTSSPSSSSSSSNSTITSPIPSPHSASSSIQQQQPPVHHSAPRRRPRNPDHVCRHKRDVGRQQRREERRKQRIVNAQKYAETRLQVMAREKKSWQPFLSSLIGTMLWSAGASALPLIAGHLQVKYKIPPRDHWWQFWRPPPQPTKPTAA